MEQKLKTYDVDLNPPEGMPTGVWDPAWDKPEVATQVALQAYGRVRHLPFDGCTLLDAGELPDNPPKNTEHRTFTLDQVLDVPEGGHRFKGGSFGEIFKRYSFGPMPAANFHAQAVFFGVDSTGRFFVDALVGLVGGTLENEAALVVRFVGEDGEVGGVAWEGPVKSETNFHLQILGTDPRLEAGFDQLTEIKVSFYAHCPGS